MDARNLSEDPRKTSPGSRNNKNSARAHQTLILTGSFGNAPIAGLAVVRNVIPNGREESFRKPLILADAPIHLLFLAERKERRSKSPI